MKYVYNLFNTLYEVTCRIQIWNKYENKYSVSAQN